MPAPPKADIVERPRHVRFVPKADIATRPTSYLLHPRRCGLEFDSIDRRQRARLESNGALPRYQGATRYIARSSRLARQFHRLQR